MRNTFLVLAVLASAALSISSAEEDDHQDHEEDAEDHIHLTDEQLRDFGVRIETAMSAEIATEVTLPGEIKLNEDRTAHVSPRYGSVVLEVGARLGDDVKRGDVLAVMENTDTLVTFDVVAPIDGRIVERHITLGETFDPGEYLYIVADLDTVWADLDVYQKDLPLVDRGQRVVIEAGDGVAPAEGEITYIGPVVSKETRTGLARIELPNEDGRWKPGMFISGRVRIGGGPAAISVERSALQQLDDETVVFVVEDHGFEPRHVQPGRRDSVRVEILTGLEAGERYAAERSFVVKAQRLKGSIDPHAGHNH